MRRVAFAALWASIVGAEFGSSAVPTVELQDRERMSIVGRVIDGSTGAAVVGAIVTLTPEAGSSGRSAAAASSEPRLKLTGAQSRVVTGTGGHFVCRDLPTGVFRLMAAAPGYAAAGTGNVNSVGRGRRVDLRPQQSTEHVTIKIWRNASISGVVLDEAAEPAVGVRVLVMGSHLRAGYIVLRVEATAKTDDRGSYRATGLAPGDYLVVVPQTLSTAPPSAVDSLRQQMPTGLFQGPTDLAAALPEVGGSGVKDLKVRAVSGLRPPQDLNGRLMAYETHFYPASQSAAEAQVIPLAPGESRQGIDFALRVGPAANLTGRVSSPTYAVAGAMVRLMRAGGAESTESSLDVAQGLVRGNGSFSLVAVPPGQYSLTVVKNPRPPVPAQLASNPVLGMMIASTKPINGEEPAFPLFAQTDVTVGGSDLNSIEIALTEGIYAEGRIGFEVAGSAAPPAEALKSVQVLLRPATGGAAVGLGKPVEPPDENGRFRTIRYPAGKYFIWPEIVDSTQQWILKSVSVAGREVLDQVVDVTGDLKDVKVTFAANAGALMGHIGGPQGAAAEEVSVLLFPSDRDVWLTSGMTSRRFYVTDAMTSGSYAIRGIQPGQYLVAALFNGARPFDGDERSMQGLAKLATRVTVGAGGTSTLDLKPVSLVR